MRAADKGNTDMVKLLLKHDADVNLASYGYKTTAIRCLRMQRIWGM